MALIFVDGFDDYTSESDILNKWDEYDSSEIDFLPTSGRFGGGCVRLNDDVMGLSKSFPLAAVTGNELYITCSMLIEDTHDSDSEPLFWLFGTDRLQASLYQSQGFLEVRRGSLSSSTLGTSAIQMLTDTWYTVEIAIVCENSGSAVVRLNGQEVINVTGDFRESSNFPGVTRIEFTGKDFPFSTGILLDDVVIYNGSGSDFNTFIGPSRIVSLSPNAVGDSSDGTPTSGDNFENVNDTGSHDGNTTQVSFSNSGEKDLYNCEDLTVSPSSIHGVVINSYTRADGTSPREAKTKIKHAASEADGADYQVPHSIGYKIRQDPFLVNPSTGLPWTESEINAMQIGIEVVT